jgi:hypothetical protein
MSTEPVTIICMKWGNLYGPEYVNHLHQGVSRHLKRPHQFVCFTDDPQGLDAGVSVYPMPDGDLPLARGDLRWRKLSLFRRDLAGLSGTALFLDLDLVILDDLEPFFSHPGKFPIIRDMDLFREKPWRRLTPKRNHFLNRVGNSSVFRFELGEHAYILDNYLRAPNSVQGSYEISQQYQSAQLAEHGHLTYWPRGWCVSFKNDCVPRGFQSYWRNPWVPLGAKIAVFAGSPKMSEVLMGGGQKWYRHIGDVSWLRQAWQG